MSIVSSNTFAPAQASPIKDKPLLSLLEAYVLVTALFIFATGAGFLTPGMLTHAENTASMVASSESAGILHQVELAVGFGATLPLIFSRWRAVLSAAIRMKYFTISAIFATSSFLWSQDPALSLRSGLYLILNTLLAFYLVIRFPTQKLMRLMILLGLVVAVISVVTAVVLPQYAWTKTSAHTALQGAFIAKNLLGNVLVLLLTPIFFVRRVGSLKRTVYIFIILSLTVLSFSFQAWSAALLCFVFSSVGNLFVRTRRRDVVWIVYITFFPLLVLMAILLTHWVEILQLVGKDPTLTGRTTIWEAVLLSISKRPYLGWGYNAFWQGFKGESAVVILSAHWAVGQAQSGVLEVLLGLGSVGLAFIVAMLVQAFFNLCTCVRYGRTNTALWYLLIILLTIFYSFGEAVLQIQNSLQWIMFIIACTGLSFEAGSIRVVNTAGATSRFRGAQLSTSQSAYLELG